jgi:hypothetical protein
MFLGETNPKRAFYANAVRSYGFLDRHHNLHGLLELETESVKNLALAKMRSRKELMFVSGLQIWNEPKLLKIMETLNSFNGDYWGEEDAKAIKEIWKVADKAKREYYDQRDHIREMHSNISNVIGTLQRWSSYKNSERSIVANILSFPENAAKWKNGKKDPDNTKNMLDDTIRQLSNLNSLKDRLNFDDDSKEWAQYGSKEFKDIKQVLVNALGGKYNQWLEQLTNLQKQLDQGLEGNAARQKDLSSELEGILNSVNGELFDKLKPLATTYNNRVDKRDYKSLLSLAQSGFRETIGLDKYKERLQSIYGAEKPGYTIHNNWLNDNSDSKGKNYNTESSATISAMDDKIPLTPKFQREVDEVVKLIFRGYNDEATITPFLDDLHAMEAFLSGQDRGKIMNDHRKDDLRYVCMIIEDFRDTKRNLDINIFKNLASWQAIFQGAARNKFENEILSKIGECLTFAKGIDSINFYAAGGYVRQAILHVLPLRLDDNQKRKVGLPTSGDMETIRKKIQEIFEYGLQIGNNDEVKLYENKEKIQEILKLLHELKLVNFPKNIDEIIDVFMSYSKVFEFVVSVWDKDYKTPLHRKTSYICKIDYEGDAKIGGENIVKTAEEL